MIIDPDKFHGTNEVAKKIKKALNNKESLALVRIGDGEARAVGHDLYNLYPSADRPFWLEYAGVQLPDELVRELVLSAIAKSDIVGFRPDRTRQEVEKILTHFNIEVDYMCSAGINWNLYESGLLYELIRDRRILLIGRLADTAAKILEEQGFNISGYEKLEGFYDLNRVFYSIKNSYSRFEIALVSAGIPSVVLCYWIADRLRKVAIDLGHIINKIIEPDFGSHKHGITVARWRYNKIPLNSYQPVLIKSNNSPRIYLYLYGFKHYIANKETLIVNNLDFMEPIILTPNIVKKIPDGPTIE